MSKNITIEQFILSLPSERKCLDNLFKSRYDNECCPKCVKRTDYRKIRKRKCYQCSECLHQVYPMAGTIMENSTTELRKWLIAMYFMIQCKNSVSAKEISSLIGVTYKCAWRMCSKIREAMKDDNLEFLSGVIEIDETFVGGRKKNFYGLKNFNPFTNKLVIFGMYQRNGKVKLKLVKNTSKKSLLPPIIENVKTGSTIYSDENSVYKELPKFGYQHEFITHKKKEWSRGDITTNRIEGCWTRMKNSIRGTFIHLSEKHIENYLNEFEFKHNNREKTNREKFLKLSSLVGFEFNNCF